MVMAMITFSIPVPSTVTTASAMMIKGNAMKTSNTRCKRRSNQPPK